MLKKFISRGSESATTAGHVQPLLNFLKTIRILCIYIVNTAKAGQLNKKIARQLLISQKY